MYNCYIFTETHRCVCCQHSLSLGTALRPNLVPYSFVRRLITWRPTLRDVKLSLPCRTPYGRGDDSQFVRGRPTQLGVMEKGRAMLWATTSHGDLTAHPTCQCRASCSTLTYTTQEGLDDRKSCLFYYQSSWEREGEPQLLVPWLPTTYGSRMSINQRSQVSLERRERRRWLRIIPTWLIYPRGVFIDNPSLSLPCTGTLCILAPFPVATNNEGRNGSLGVTYCPSQMHLVRWFTFHLLCPLLSSTYTTCAHTWKAFSIIVLKYYKDKD